MELNAARIKDALAYVHYHEARERGVERIERADAVRRACSLFALSDAERDILLRATHVELHEVTHG